MLGVRFTDKSPHDFLCPNTLSKRSSFDRWFWPFSPERFPGLNINQWKMLSSSSGILRRGTKTCRQTPPDNQGFKPHTLKTFSLFRFEEEQTFTQHSKYSWGELLTSPPWFMNNWTTRCLCATFTHTSVLITTLRISTVQQIMPWVLLVFNSTLTGDFCIPLHVTKNLDNFFLPPAEQ